MTISLHDAVIPSQIQILGSVRNLLTSAEKYCAEKGLDAKEIIKARLADDMLPFSYQVKSAAEHSLGAIEGVRKGSYSPDTGPFPDNFADLFAKIDNASEALRAIDPAEIDGFVGQDMKFVFGEHSLDFTAECFLLTFSQPNFYFHATTAYDILRWKGVPLGKRDFMGALRTKAVA
ncbi:DUF1993 domain-containing protein [Sphingopyxis sp.]|uniref:DUF1993 domain-containing protein n=1 Tax=Sphingopyxis sp. TaxID=1908224 RepID=UPI003D6C8631